MLTSLNLSQPLMGNPGTPGIPPNTTITSEWVDVSPYYAVLATITQANAGGTLYIDLSNDRVTYYSVDVAYSNVQQLYALTTSRYARIRVVTGSQYTTSGYAYLGSSPMPVETPIPTFSPNLVPDSNLANAIATEGATWIPNVNTTIGTGADDFNVLNPGTDQAEWVQYGNGTTQSLTNSSMMSRPISVNAGDVLTVASIIDATNATSASPQIRIRNATTIFASAYQSPGVKSLVSTSYTVLPTDPTIMWIDVFGGNAHVATGLTVSWSQIQLTKTSTVQPYQPGPLYVGNIVPYNLSATGTVSATHVNATPNTSVTLTPAAQPLVSGTVYQNLTGGPVQVMQPITGAVAGTAQIALGPSSSPPDFGAAETILLNSTKNISFVVPNGWYCSITASGETFGTTQLIGL